ncbi:AI-2E family transporter [Sphingomonas abietis]|uniref:AI-2E family transporter n=1 Tax=Sphingomonas abietis TaxID=3012344 RepID=A0ABY7NQ10_9SPHN|nr:AI-2E family transporter [Sphingomonas abietis]WBO21576.1 AI-2E family transporter [Sphingomonas abietis]
MAKQQDDIVEENDAPIAKPGTYRQGGKLAMSRAQLRASLLAAAILFIAGIITLKDFLPALGWTAIFAIALWPIYVRLSTRWPQHRRGAVPALLVCGILLAFVVPLLIVVVPLVADTHAVMQWVSQTQQNGIPAPAFLSSLPFGTKLVPLWQNELGQPGGLAGLAHHAVQASGAGLGRKIAGEAVHRLVLIGFMLLTLLFLLRDVGDVVDGLRIGSHRAFGPAGESVGRQLIRAVQGTVNGLVFVGLGEGVLMGIAYAVAGVPHPTLFGLLTAILAMVPFGAALAFCAAGIALLVSGSTVAAIVIVVLGFAVTFIADHFVRPVLIEGATRLPFVWVLLGILGGVEAWGLIGLVMGPAIMAGLMLLWREWIGSQKGPINPARGVSAEAGAGIEQGSVRS